MKKMTIEELKAAMTGIRTIEQYERDQKAEMKALFDNLNAPTAE